MKKLYLNRQWRNQSFGGGNHFVKAWYKHFEEQEKSGNKQFEVCMPTDNKASPDIALLVGLDNDGTGLSIDQLVQYRMMFKPNMKIFVRVNENDARKRTTGVDQRWIKVSEHVDGSIFVSHWLEDYFMKLGWKCKNNTVIINGVDRDEFNPSIQKLNNGKINIVTAHWSDNQLKGQDVSEWLDEFVKENNDFTFTFIGRTKANLKHSKHIQPIHGKALGDELAKYDVCINGSRWDPGPNSTLEPIACGLPTYVHKDGGGSVEFAGKDHVFSNLDDLKKLLLRKRFKQNKMNPALWNEVMNDVINFITT